MISVVPYYASTHPKGRGEETVGYLPQAPKVNRAPQKQRKWYFRDSENFQGIRLPTVKICVYVCRSRRAFGTRTRQLLQTITP